MMHIYAIDAIVTCNNAATRSKEFHLQVQLVAKMFVCVNYGQI